MYVLVITTIITATFGIFQIIRKWMNANLQWKWLSLYFIDIAKLLKKCAENELFPCFWKTEISFPSYPE